jgi:hypothetical protein
MKKTILAITMLTLFGCGSEESSSSGGSTETFHSPIVKLTNTTDNTVLENHSITIPYNVYDQDSDAFDIQITISSESGNGDYGTIKVNQENQTFSILANEVEASTVVNVSITAFDEQGLESTDSMILNIENITYEAPTIVLDVPEEDPTINEGESYTFGYTITDPDSDISDITIKTAADNHITLAELFDLGDLEHTEEAGDFIVDTDNQTITFTPASIRGDDGMVIAVYITDNQGLTGYDGFNINVIEAINNKPVINFSTEQQEIKTDESFMFNFTATDEDELDELKVSHYFFLKDPRTCVDISSCWVLEDLGYTLDTLGNNDFSWNIELNFPIPTQEIYMLTIVEDGFDFTQHYYNFDVKQREETMLPTLSFTNVNEVSDLSNIEVLETDNLSFNIEVDSTIGQILSHSVSFDPAIDADYFIETDNTTERVLSEMEPYLGEIVNESGSISFNTSSFNVSGYTTTNIKFSLLNEYGYKTEVNLPITIIENVVREYEHFEENFNNSIYEYASKKLIEEEELLYKAYLDYLVIKRRISLHNKNSFIENFKQLRIAENTDIEHSISVISNLLEADIVNYESANNVFVHLKSLIESYGVSLATEINSKAMLDNDNNLPAITEDNINIAYKSRFIGNLEYGFWTDETEILWIFNEKYKLLELLQSQITQTCKGQ